ncbi:MAG: 5'-nucleotidase C-terminal domain-containing protein [Chitinophagales bacterium]|nr:5'-nucleotidase C-terminal domain-containing protein [Chitinophagales bacterium]MDW8426978.1 5'-nucleotidase C-terminal domain-containing protein [Chitinophagales bacterium]
MSNSRRGFLKTLALTGAAGLLFAGSRRAAGAWTSEAPVSLPTSPTKGRFTISILHTTDVHCQIHPHDELFWENGRAVFRKTGGYAHLATFFRKYRKNNPYTFIVDTGDMFQGSLLSVETQGAALVPILNALGYDLYLPGNWEVIYYKKNMQRLLGSLWAPKVCANMYHDLGEGQKGELIFPPYYVWSINGIKIGFLGYTDPLVPLRQSPNYSKGIVYTKPEDNLPYYVSVLREQEQCSFVIILAHLGLSQQIHLANQEVCKGVDYILGGDTHERVRQPIQCRFAKVVEPGAFGSFVGELRLTVEDGKIVRDDYQLMEIGPHTHAADRQMVSLIEQVEAPYRDRIYQIVGYSTVPLYRYFVIENPIDTLILDALRWRLPDVDIVLSNGFRFCPPRVTPDHTGNIPITNGYLYDMLPVDSPIKTGVVTGKQLREWLEKELNNVFAKNASERFGGWLIKFDGMHVKFLAFGPKGHRVQEVLVGGEPLSDERRYRIAACERDGDPDHVLCRISNVQEPQLLPYTLHETLRNYLKLHVPVSPRPRQQAVALDAPPTLLTQVTGVPYEFR